MKKAISIVLALAICLLLVIPTLAAEAVVKTADELQEALSTGGNIVLGSDIGVESTVTVAANTSIDLNGHKLSIIVTKYGKSGLVINLGQTLTVSDTKFNEANPGDGKLYVIGYRAGIQTTGATLIINSGVVDVQGQYDGCGIGGAASRGFYDGGTVTINGGIVTATGGENCAGIGGAAFYLGPCGNGGKVTINGGLVTATGGEYAAGIGGGGVTVQETGGSGATVAVNGGNVRAAGGTRYRNVRSFDIGGGNKSIDGGSLTVTGGTIEFFEGGTNANNPTFQSCTITGEGAGEYEGTYDATGNKIVADNSAVGVTVNGSAVTWTDAAPFIDKNNRTMVPLRAVGDALGLTVDWDGAKREAFFTDGTKTIYFPIDSTNARTSDSNIVTMDTAAVIVNDRTYAPIRYLAEFFGYAVGWDGETRTVQIT